ncbi:MAG TPA: protoporphyrinogen oxidase [Minicystis sp.]|nr:protoporphyrinogen oxidase [Minicystis sp.]
MSANGTSSLRVAVVGGGITGLTAAYRLLRGGVRSVALYEERAKLGGNIQTERRDGFVIDGGPDSFVANKPQATALCKELGLESHLIATTARNRKVYLEQDGKLVPMPEGLMLGVPTRFLPMVTTPIFSMRGKLRMGLEPLMPRGEAWTDESIAHFMRRRLGREVLDRVAEPLLGGIYAGDVEALSMRATFPQLVDMEQKHGSLIRGALAARAAREHAAPKKNGPPPSPFFSLTGGMGELVDALARAVHEAGGHVRTSTRVEAVAPRAGDGGRFEVRSAHADGTREAAPADHVIMASPAHAAASALAGLDDELATRLRLVPYVSTATVVLAFPRADVPHPLDAVGIVLPKDDTHRALAATFISSKWTGRAPEDMALLRIFLGGHRDPGVLDATDEELVALACKELEALLGVRARPAMSRVFRYERANPQPLVGHVERVMRLRQLANGHPGLHLAGAAYDGVGLPDCVRQANEVADRILRGAV